jgi:hypothetical protein
MIYDRTVGLIILRRLIGVGIVFLIVIDKTSNVEMNTYTEEVLFSLNLPVQIERF